MARRLVIKLGTRVLTNSGDLAEARLREIVRAVVALRKEGKQVLLVSSGAVGLGKALLGLKKDPESQEERQACAAVGQSRLMAFYQCELQLKDQVCGPKMGVPKMVGPATQKWGCQKWWCRPPKNGGQRQLGIASAQQRTAVLLHLSRLLKEREAEILMANQRDLQAAATEDLAPPLLKRLGLNSAKLDILCRGVEQLAACSLALRSGNGILLKGGREALHSNRALVGCLREALTAERLSADAVHGVEGRDTVAALLGENTLIDLVIPRGSARWSAPFKARLTFRCLGTPRESVIVTDNPGMAQSFLDQVDSASIFVNASTRFADGYRYGLGAEVGISTGRIHARGPVGVDGLLTTRWLLRGCGQTPEDYGPGKRAFTHRSLPV
jgi:hypothetical protein